MGAFIFKFHIKEVVNVRQAEFSLKAGQGCVTGK
jgi:hypothetical protein